jgi:hypothetical protein
MSTFCNGYGSENPGGHAVNNMAPFEAVPAVVKDQWNCDRRDTHRFRWTCEHGHKGKVVSLCPKHWAEFNGERTYPDTGQPVPFTIRREVSYCPRCNAGEDLPRGVPADHKCAVRLELIS